MSISCTAELLISMPESNEGGTLAFRWTQCIRRGAPSPPATMALRIAR